ncbi:pirin family protein [Paucibacter sp. DJ1R-11]|uniref:pirin family protein n=1 Tax=Paucibacter sp. DJ1R-11 TaxID=2893556 RepID=UPI0021E3D588|nr:pirin family protein [Paucibacter sp. DJ1R-11]MCV2364881.1 pirin family protein [Paucibacter sp. DJ1R-11]
MSNSDTNSSDSSTPAAPFDRIHARRTELGEGLTIRRALPTAQRRRVGAWCFLDHIGPVQFEGQALENGGLHVGGHPHIGLQTFTWMIEGEILHRDSLGSEQLIRPGEVNLMTAGHGIVHTEDAPAGTARIHAAQLWIALPPGEEDRPPAFEHHASLPRWQEQGAQWTLLAGSHAGRTAPPRVYTPLLGLEIHAPNEAVELRLDLRPDFEHGLLPLEGELGLGRETLGTGELAYLAPGQAPASLHLSAGGRLLLLGGEPFPAEIEMWWNFVGLSRAAVARAQADWDAQREAGGPRFGRVQGDEGRRLVAPRLPASGY